MAQAGSNYEKNEGPKSRWTVPLISCSWFIKNKFIILCVNILELLKAFQYVPKFGGESVLNFCNITVGTMFSNAFYRKDTFYL